MSGSEIKISQNCRKCAAVLDFEEMHYYDHGDGTASCNKCESKWMKLVDDWRAGIIDSFPEMP